jgi:2,5-diketo-D-gluconate reductase B
MRYDTPEDCVRSVAAALDMGYRHVDTAQKYENEREVGRGIEQADVSRDDVFLATKIAESNLAHDDVLGTAAESLDRLGVDQVDLLYVHWPAVTYDAEGTLSAFNELLDEGATRHVGLANVTPELLDEALDILDRPPLAIQVEMHPLLQQPDLRAYAREHDMYLVAYCPLMRGDVFEVPELQSIAEDAGLSIPEVCIAWLATKENVIPIPKATGESHLRANLEAASLSLPADVVDRVDAIDRERRVVDPPEKGPWNW